MKSICLLALLLLVVSCTTERTITITHEYVFESLKTFPEADVTEEIGSKYPNLPNTNIIALVNEEKVKVMIEEVRPLCDSECTKSCSAYKANKVKGIGVGSTNYTCTCLCSDVE